MDVQTLLQLLQLVMGMQEGPQPTQGPQGNLLSLLNTHFGEPKVTTEEDKPAPKLSTYQQEMKDKYPGGSFSMFLAPKTTIKTETGEFEETPIDYTPEEIAAFNKRREKVLEGPGMWPYLVNTPAKDLFFYGGAGQHQMSPERLQDILGVR